MLVTDTTGTAHVAVSACSCAVALVAMLENNIIVAKVRWLHLFEKYLFISVSLQLFFMITLIVFCKITNCFS